MNGRAGISSARLPRSLTLQSQRGLLRKGYFARRMITVVQVGELSGLVAEPSPLSVVFHPTT